MPCCGTPFASVRLGHLKCLTLYRTEDLLLADNSGYCLLHVAAKLGNLRVINYLIDKAPCLMDARNDLHETPLIVAANYGQIHVVCRLLDTPHNEALQRACHQDKNGTTCLLGAVEKSDNEIALFLLKRFGKTLCAIGNKLGMLPLHVAASNGNVEFIRIATKYDQKMVHIKDSFGSVPLIYAIQSKCIMSIRYLVEKAKSDVKTKTSKGQTLLHVACINGDVPTIKYFLNILGTETILVATNDLANCLHCATFHGNIDALKLLVEYWPKKKRKGVLGIRDSRGNTPLHLAAINNHSLIAQYLISYLVNTRATNNLSQTALEIARKRNAHAVFKIIKTFEGALRFLRSTQSDDDCSTLIPDPPRTVVAKNGKPLDGNHLHMPNQDVFHKNMPTQFIPMTQYANGKMYDDEAFSVIAEIDKVLENA
uniref:ANK_REP_REGION domain-containing protein n=1 Tax=Rhabditophanes sp. KR3021 TaxID=114890 RepID=A0AC35TYJ7_9BILA